MAFKPILLEYLKGQLENQMPKLDFFPYNGRIPKGDHLKKKVETLLSGKSPSDFVIALSDVYTGTNDFRDADDAKQKMKSWVGSEHRFEPHVALHDFEAWLLPYWSSIKQLAGHDRTTPGKFPEQVNHGKPPSYHIKEVFAAGKTGRHYSKTRDAKKILQGKNLQVAIDACPELKAFIDTLIRISADPKSN